MAWLLCIAGTILCLAGVFHYKKNVFEEGKSTRSSIWIMVLGVLLIAAGTAKYFGIIR